MTELVCFYRFCPYKYNLTFSKHNKCFTGTAEDKIWITFSTSNLRGHWYQKNIFAQSHVRKLCMFVARTPQTFRELYKCISLYVSKSLYILKTFIKQPEGVANSIFQSLCILNCIGLVFFVCFALIIEIYLLFMHELNFFISRDSKKLNRQMTLLIFDIFA